jgi:hypothetical protein
LTGHVWGVAGVEEARVEAMGPQETMEVSRGEVAGTTAAVVVMGEPVQGDMEEVRVAGIAVAVGAPGDLPLDVQCLVASMCPAAWKACFAACVILGSQFCDGRYARRGTNWYMVASPGWV